MAGSSTDVGSAEPPPLRDLLQRLHEDGWRETLARALHGLSEPTDFLRLLKAESERHWSLDPGMSLRYAEALVEAARALNEQQHLALGVMAQADSLRYLGRYAESAALFEDAAQRFLACEDEVGWARTRIGSLVTAHLLGRGAEHLAEVGRAHAVLVGAAEWLRAAGLDINAGVVCMELGRFKQARRHYDRALRLFRRAAEADPSLAEIAEVRAAKATANKAMLMTLLGDSRAALPLHDASYAVFVRRGEVLSALRQQHNIAQVYLGQGQYGRALRLLAEALNEAERAGLDDEAGWITLDMVDCYLRLNRGDDALPLAEDAVVRFERCGTPTEAAKARYACALAQAALGDLEGALVPLELAAVVFDAAGMASHSGAVALQRSRLHLAAGNTLAAWDEATRAERMLSGLGMTVRVAQAQLVRARAALELERLAAATELANTALIAARTRALPWLAHEGRHVLARLALRRGARTQALREYRAAILAIEQVQSRLPAELRIHFLADKREVFHEAIACSLASGRRELAFEYLERSKSRALVDFLASQPNVPLRGRPGASQALLEELTSVREEHNWAYNRLYGNQVIQRPEEEAPGDAEIAQLRAVVRDQERRITRLLERLSVQGADVIDTAGVGPPGAAFEPPRLDATTVMLEYYVGGDQALVFVVVDDALDVVRLPATTSAVVRSLRRWQLNLELSARTRASGEALDYLEYNARGILMALYDALVRPVAHYLQGRERVVVVPYGPLHGAPFHALHDGARFLLERLEVSACPSSGVLQMCGRHPGRPVLSALVVASSDGGRLPYVLEEVHEVAALLPAESYLEEQATRAAVAGAASRHGVLHLAAHGEARLDRPMFAHIKLADGQLSTVDVLNLELEGALVVLSACETGRAVVTGGDEVVGLSRGFLHAGARTLIQSLWRVEDRSTASLMQGFYRGLHGGRPPAAALRESQLALLATDPHPYIWAPFQLVGSS